MPARKPPSTTSSLATGDLPELLARLEHWLLKHRPRYAKGLQPGATAADLKAYEFPLPDELQTLLRWHNGQSQDFVGHFEQDWDLMSAAEIATTKKALDADAARGWKPSWIPFLQDDGDDYVCLDPSQSGIPVLVFWQGTTEHPTTAPSLAAWMREFVEAVERGEYREDPDRGSFLRREA